MPMPMTPPTDTDIDTAVEAEGQVVDKTVQMNVPTGRYSSARLATFAQNLQAVLDLLAPNGIKLNTKFPNVKPSTPMQLPTDLVAALLTARSAESAWSGGGEAAEGESSLPDPLSLVDDSSLAMASGSLQKLTRDKAFQKWAKSQVQEVSSTEPTPEGQPVSIDDQVSALFG